MRINRRFIYQVLMAIVILVGIVLRLSIPNIHRQLISGDETTYHYAALDILKYHVLTREVAGEIYKGHVPVSPTSKLSPGYPFYLAGVYTIFGPSTKVVFATQIAMSVLCVFLAWFLLHLADVNRVGKLLAVALISVYPGFLYNIDRMLTEQIFTFLLLLYVCLFLSGWKRARLSLIILSGASLACAAHVRAESIPFALLSVVWLAVYGERSGREKIIFISYFLLPILLLFIPWWVRNYLDFGRIILLTNAGDSAKVWGSVPYFIDMASTNHRSLASIASENMKSNPGVYYRWRIFGFLQYMWGDIWDEKIVHPVRILRSLLVMQPLIVVPTILAIPVIAWRRSSIVLFIATIPLAFTLMCFPYHGLPRYVYPGIPFVFILTGVAVGYLADTISSESAPTSVVLNAIDWIIRYGFICLSSILSLLIFYSVYIFAFHENMEMSKYRLGRYMGVSLIDVKNSRLVESKIFPGSSLVIENASRKNGRFVNDVDGPPILKIRDSRVVGGRSNIVTEVTLRMRGGYLYDYSTIYWVGEKTHSISENSVYRFPNSVFLGGRTAYIDDDVTFLMIVPYVFRGGHFDIQSVVLRKYAVANCCRSGSGSSVR